MVVSARDDALVAFDSAPVQLVLIAERAESEKSFEFAGKLRRRKPDGPVMMVWRVVELALVVQGIRNGLTDVMRGGADLAPMARRVKALAAETGTDEPSGAELAEAEAMLAQLDPEYAGLERAEKTDQPSTLVEQQTRELEIKREQVGAVPQVMEKKTGRWHGSGERCSERITN